MTDISGPDREIETRLKILEFLRRGQRSVRELADQTGLTPNAVRSQLRLLEHSGWVERTGLRPGARRPAVLYGVTPKLAVDQSRAYGPVLAQLLAVLRERLDPETMIQILRSVGSRLATAQPRPPNGRSERFRHARDVLQALGASADLIDDKDGLRLQGYGCPLALAVKSEPRVCEAVRTLLSDIVGEALIEQCDRTDDPRCCFRAAS